MQLVCSFVLVIAIVMYYQLLGLDQPPGNFYQLLNLPATETDPARIRLALTAAAARLRDQKTAARRDPELAMAWQAAAKHVKAAERVLLDDERKRQYDEKLRQQLASRFDDLGAPVLNDPMAPIELPQSAANPVPPPVHAHAEKSSDDEALRHVGQPAAGRKPFTAAGPKSVTARLRQSRTVPGSYWAYAMIALMLVGMFACFVTVLRLWVLNEPQLAGTKLPETEQIREGTESSVVALDGGEASRESPADPKVVATSLRPDLATNESDRSPGRTVEDSTGAPAGAPTTRAKQLDVAPVAGRGTETSGELAALESEPVAQELPPSSTNASADSPSVAEDSNSASGPAVPQLSESQRRELYETLTAARAALAARDAERARQLSQHAVLLAGESGYAEVARRLDTVADYVQQYWQSYRESLASLKGVDLTVGRGQVHVVDVKVDHLVVQELGRLRRLELEHLPVRYVMAIAARGFNPGAASTGIFRGAFMWSTGEFTAEEVDRVWQLARVAGADLDDLALILEDQYESIKP